eukprot:CAMPEP_0197051330 /NCGR_PEP_ID=MMETSP1384-20130603/26023_1 /TAXON_ID=29189 /ORGANISM="Ammonia sp." /LENGTH=259 /DNA_ID=CAMNT_0042483879 /DNA_START=73 /DNA_END=850 /DNA_ORIENTATION=+
MSMHCMRLVDELITAFCEPAPQSTRNRVSTESDEKASCRNGIIEFQQDCILLRDVFDIDEQYELFKAVMLGQSLSKQPKGKQNTNKNFNNIMKVIPSNKFHQCRLSPIYDQIFDRTFDILTADTLSLQTKLPSVKEIHKYRMKALQYTAPNGNIFRHYDNRKGWVLLYSIGCSVVFYVKGPKMKESATGIQFQMNSGDVLIFNASGSSRIEHGVDSVVDNSCPPALLNKDKQCLKLQQVESPCKRDLKLRIQKRDSSDL